MKIFVAGLSYKTAPVEVRERLAVLCSQLSWWGCRLKLRSGLAEIVLLSTCNRVELYGVCPEGSGNIAGLFEEMAGANFDYSTYCYVKEGEDAASHLYAVVSGLDSMVLGETEITGQVKHAYLAV